MTSVKAFKFSELQVGQKDLFTVVVTDDLVDRFANVSGDQNPLHVDSSYAKGQGFTGRVVHGMCTGSFFSRFVGMNLPGKFSLLHGMDLQFKKPVFIGDQLTIQGEIVHLMEAFQQVELKLTATNQHGTVVTVGKAKVGVMDRD